MSKKPSRSTRVSLQATDQPAKALAQYEAFKARGELKSALIIGRTTDGDFHVLSQGMSLHEIAESLFAAAEAAKVANARERERQRAPKVDDPRPAEPPERQPDQQRPRASELKRQADGTLIAPEGETFIHCGECGSTRWMILDYVATREQGPPSRYVCGACGNEVKFVRLSEPGTA